LQKHGAIASSASIQATKKTLFLLQLTPENPLYIPLNRVLGSYALDVETPMSDARTLFC
jgi:hypothetical protein